MSQSPTQRVADTVRAELARAGISGSELARQIGWSQAATSRRLTGQVVIDVAELTLIADAIGIPVIRLLDTEVAA